VRRRLALAALAGLAAVAAGGSGALATAASGAAGAGTTRAGGPVGAVRVFAHVPPPGYPALTLVAPERHRTVYVSTFTGVNGGTPGPSKVFAYSASGHLRRTYVLRGQTKGADNHAVQVAARDRQGRLYLLDQTPARIVRLNPRTGRQTTWATFRDLPTCSSVNRPSNCSNSVTDNPPEPDYAAWLPDGSMLVTDYAQQLIWRVGRHGGRAHVWVNDARFDGEQFGPAGIVLAPHRRGVYLTVSAGGVTTSGANDDATRGKLYRIGIEPSGRPRRIRQLWASGRGEAPDGFAVSRSGRFFVALSGPSGNAVAELVHRTGGGYRVVRRFPGSASAAQTSSPPWDTSTSVQFLGRSILVTNQAYFTGDTSHMVVFRVAVGQRGQPIFVPRRH
jgi:sugar lactone lactonase YvrE